MANKIPQSNLINPTFDSDEEARRVLQAEGRKLKYIAIKLWRKYLQSYQPTQYVRTRDSQRSIKLGNVFKLDNDEWAIELTYVNDLAYHDSVITGSKKQGHSIMLISDGWHNKKLEAAYGRRVDRHTYFEGTGYIYKVYKEYMKTRDNRVSLDVQWSGEVQRIK